MDVIAATDNKGLWENLHNTRQCEEMLLINSVCSSNEKMLENHEVNIYNGWKPPKCWLIVGCWNKEVISRKVIYINMKTFLEMFSPSTFPRYLHI